MAFGDVVQSNFANNGTGANDVTATLAGDPTSGNLLILCHSSPSTTAPTTPTDFSIAREHDNSTTTGIVFYKISDGTEGTGYTVSHGTSQRQCLGVVEVEGPWEAAPLDQVQSAGDGTTDVTSQSTGTTGTTTQADEFAFAFFVNRARGDVFASAAYSNSFTLIGKTNTSGSNTSTAMAAARLVLTATGTQECTVSSMSGDAATNVCLGIMATFMASGGGGGGSTQPPRSMHQFRMRRAA